MHRLQRNYRYVGRPLLLPVMLAALAAVRLAVPAGDAQAAVLTWDAEPATPDAQDGSGNWDLTTENWISGGVNLAWTDGDDAVFGAGGTGIATVTLTQPVSVRNLTFNAGASYTIDGDTLTRTGTITVNVPEARIDAVVTGAGSHKYGSGRLILAGDNTMSGGAFDIRGGVVNLRHSKALGTYDYCHVYETTAALEVQDDITVTNGIYIKGHGVAGTGSLRSVSGNNVWAGYVRQHSANPDSTIGVDAGSTLTITGRIEPHSGTSGTLTKVGEGALILANSNTYTGPTVVAAGVLNIRHNNALGTTDGDTTVQSGAALEVQGGITVGETLVINGTGIGNAGVLRSISGNNVWNGNVVHSEARIGVDADTLTINGQLSGSGTLRKTGAGKLILAGENTLSGNALDVDGGVVNLQHGQALGTSNYGHVRALGAAVEIQNGVTVANNLYIRGYGVDGTGSLRSVSGDNTWAGWVRQHSGHPDSSIGVDSGSTLTISGVIEPHEGTSGILAKVGGGTLILTNANTYTGPTTVDAGVLSVRHDDALGAPGAGTTVQSGAALEVHGGVAVAEGLTLNGSGVSNTGALRSTGGDNVWNGNIVQNAARIGAVPGSTLTINGQISGSGTFRTTGGGTVIFTGNNTYSATTDVVQGILNIRHNNALGTSSYCHVHGGATLELEGGISVARGLYIGNTNPASATPALRNVSGDNAWNGAVYLHISYPHAIIDVASGSLTINGVVGPYSGSVGSLTKRGDGLLVFTNNNTYVGPTTVAAGTLLVNGSLHASSAVTVEDGGTLGGTGTIGGPTSIEAGGTLATGASVGTLTFGSDLTLEEGAIWDWEFIDSTPGNYDQAIGDNGAALILPTDATTPIMLNIFGDAGGHWVKWYDEFTIFDGAVENFDAGLFDLVNHSDWAHGWQIFSDGQNLVLTAVPEPGAIVLLVFGLL
ncbi:MAG: autotransporter-associated beta strand repeat-containing protein, partial [Thermoguttaceae bacterium]|nr:autotransporter-associated beta strand repeat-containing protein [Thermoguttaceae bacterium]